MKIILTGANGNLGKEISRCEAFEKILPINRNNWNDLTDVQPNAFDAVIHCAYDLKNKISDSPVSVLNSNILSTAKILEISRNINVKKIVFISSSAVYGESSNTAEDSTCHPITFNGHTKLLNEELIKAFCKQNNIEYLILRAFNSFGGDDRFSVVHKLISAAKNKTPFTLVNEGSAERDFIHIADIAQIVCRLTLMNCSNEIVNIGSGHAVRVKDIFMAIEKKWGNINVSHREDENEAVFSKANIKKLNKLVKHKYINIFDFINS